MNTPPPKSKGRPKGIVETKPRRKANGWVLPKEVIRQAKKDLITLGPDGRSLDEIGILRSAAMAVLSIAIREIEQVGPEFIERRRSLTALFDSIHRAEGRAIDQMGQSARSFDLPAHEIENAPKSEDRPDIEPQLKDWRARVLDDERGTPQ
jgi:hypothetical protein